MSSSSSSSTTGDKHSKKLKAGTDPLNMMLYSNKKKQLQQSSNKSSTTTTTNTNSTSSNSTNTSNDSSLSSSTQSKSSSSSSSSSTSLNIYSMDNDTIAYLNKFYTDKSFIRQNAKLLPCEEIENVEKSSYKVPDVYSMGVLILTKFRLIFKFQDPSQVSKLDLNDEYFYIELFKISTITQNKDKKSIDYYTIDITLKNSNKYTFYIFNTSNLKFFADLNEWAFPKNSEHLFAFSFRYLNYLYSKDEYFPGWELYKPKDEFERQGLFSNKVNANGKMFRFTQINMNMQIVESYPEALIVRSNTSDYEIEKARLCRVNNRFPTLTYFYGKKGLFSSLWISSQLKANIMSDDSKYIADIIAINDMLNIYDIRPNTNSLVNRFKGGNDRIENYAKSRVITCEIDTIQNLHNAYDSLTNMSQGDKIMNNQKFWSSLESTTWYEYVRCCLKYADNIVSDLLKNETILLHCETGTDYTPIISSLAQLLIDPYYRTLTGFAVLVQKEWLSFGFPFGIRHGIFIGMEANEQEISPLFILWLDCIHQLLHQFPNAFEFNSELLLFLAENCNSNLYGTFLFNNQKEREMHDAYIKTTSVWSDVLYQRKRFMNLYYSKEHNTDIIMPNCAFYKIKFWDEHFMRNSNYAGNNGFYLDESKQIKFKSEQEFYDWQKKEDENKMIDLNNEIDVLNNVLVDLYDITKGDAVFAEIDDYAKNVMKSITSLKGFKY